MKKPKSSAKVVLRDKNGTITDELEMISLTEAKLTALLYRNSGENATVEVDKKKTSPIMKLKEKRNEE